MKPTPRGLTLDVDCCRSRRASCLGTIDADEAAVIDGANCASKPQQSKTRKPMSGVSVYANKGRDVQNCTDSGMA